MKKKVLIYISIFVSALLVLTACNLIGMESTSLKPENNDNKAQVSGERLIFDSADIYSKVLSNYRSCKDINRIKTINKNSVNSKGLEGLKISGSAEFSSFNWDNIVGNKNSADVIIVDLRMECHGFINDQIPVSWYENNNWYNLHKTNIEIKKYENEKIRSLSKTGLCKIYLEKSGAAYKSIKVKNSVTEEGFVLGKGADYIRFFVPDHCRPSNEAVDIFLDFVNKVPKTKWLHFHCKAGKGRTTTFMAMYDIIKNYHHASFDDIIMRQYYLGGSNLFDTDVEEYKKNKAEMRLQFLRDFYSFCLENRSNPGEKWSDWIKRVNKS